MKTIKTLFLIAALIFSGAMMAQENEHQPVFEKQGNLIKATFYYEDGSIRQEGTYKDGKLHGEWISYDQEGNKNAIAEYTNGEKTGKWFFWSGEKLSEVNYENSRIVSVNTWKSDGTLVSN
ncbi:MAG: nicotinic acid mononucleotide adenyltransferase [Salegentibacter sp.]